MITDEQDKLSIKIIDLLKAQEQKWMPKADIKTNLQPKSLNDFEFVLGDLEHFRLIEYLRNGLNIRLTENARKFKGLRHEFTKKDRVEKFRFRLTTSIALISLFVSIWLTVENNDLKGTIEKQESEIIQLNKKISNLKDQLDLRDSETSRVKEKLDSMLNILTSQKKKK